MKKLFTIIVLSLCLVVSSSCTTEEIKEPPKYTAKEQLDYINDNLYFKDESIKLGKPLVNYDQVEDPGRLETIKLYDYDDSITKVYRRGINLRNGEYSYKNFIYFQKDGVFDLYDDAFEIVMNNGFDNVVGETDVVKGLFSRIDNFEFFGVRYKGDLTVIDTKLKERGFYGHKGSYTYGFIKINVSTIDFYGKTVICDISLSIDNYLLSDVLYDNRELIDKIDINKEDLLKYIIPVNVVDNCIIITTSGVNLLTGIEKLNRIYFLNKEDFYTNIDIKRYLTALKYSNDPDATLEDRFYNRVCVKYLYTFSINGIEIEDKEYFVNNYQNFDFDFFEIKRLGWKGDMILDVSNFTDDYKYLADLIVNEEGYEEYRSAHPLE